MPHLVELAQPQVDSPVHRISTESFHKKILDNLYDGVYFVDADRTITY